MNKQATLRQIAELWAEQESAIQNHPPATSAVYMEGRAAFMKGQKSAKEEDWMRLSGITFDELSLIHRCMLSSSFISAWWHLSADKKQRDAMAQSCCLVVTSLLGLDFGERVMRRYLDYENDWLRIMKAEGVAPRRVSAKEVNTLDVVTILINRVSFASTESLKRECIEMGMNEQDYLNPGMDQTLPKFGEGVHLIFESDDHQTAHMEILGRQGRVLQAGFQLIYRPTLFLRKWKKQYDSLCRHMADHYGLGTPLAVSGVVTINYGDERSLAYISRSKANMCTVLTVRVGNRDLWEGEGDSKSETQGKAPG